MYPEAFGFAPKPPEPKPQQPTGFFPGLGRGLQGGAAQTGEALGELGGLEGLRQYSEEQKRIAAEKAIGDETWRGKAGEAIGNVIGRFGAPMAAGAVAAAAAPEFALASLGAGALGFVAADLPLNIGESLAAQREAGQTQSAARATATGIAKTAIDTLGGEVLAGPMRSIIGKTAIEQAQPLVKEVLAGNMTVAQATEKLSGFLKNFMQSTAQNAVVGPATMVARDVTERVGLGQEVASPEAMKQYGQDLLSGVEVSPVFGALQARSTVKGAKAALEKAGEARQAAQAATPPTPPDLLTAPGIPMPGPETEEKAQAPDVLRMVDEHKAMTAQVPEIYERLQQAVAARDTANIRPLADALQGLNYRIENLGKKITDAGGVLGTPEDFETTAAAELKTHDKKIAGAEKKLDAATAEGDFENINKHVDKLDELQQQRKEIEAKHEQARAQLQKQEIKPGETFPLFGRGQEGAGKPETPQEYVPAAAPSLKLEDIKNAIPTVYNPAEPTTRLVEKKINGKYVQQVVENPLPKNANEPLSPENTDRAHKRIFRAVTQGLENGLTNDQITQQIQTDTRGGLTTDTLNNLNKLLDEQRAVRENPPVKKFELNKQPEAVEEAKQTEVDQRLKQASIEDNVNTAEKMASEIQKLQAQKDKLRGSELTDNAALLSDLEAKKAAYDQHIKDNLTPDTKQLDLFTPQNERATGLRNEDPATIKALVDEHQLRTAKESLARRDQEAADKARLIKALDDRLNLGGRKVTRTATPEEYDRITNEINRLQLLVEQPIGNNTRSYLQQAIDLAAKHQTLLDKKAAGAKGHIERTIGAVLKEYNRIMDKHILPIRDRIVRLHQSLYSVERAETATELTEKRKAQEEKQRQSTIRPPSEAEAKEGVIGRAVMSRAAKTTARINKGDVVTEAVKSSKMRDIAQMLGRDTPEFETYMNARLKKQEALNKKYGEKSEQALEFKRLSGEETSSKAIELGQKTPEYKEELAKQVEFMRNALGQSKQELPTKRTGAATRNVSRAKREELTGTPESREATTKRGEIARNRATPEQVRALQNKSEAAPKVTKTRRKATSVEQGRLRSMFDEAIRSEREGGEDSFARGVETESPNLNETQLRAIDDNDINAVYTDIANDKNAPEINRVIAQRLSDLLDNTNVVIRDKITDKEGNEVLGVSLGDTIGLSRNGGLSHEVLLHEGIHQGVDHVLDMPEANLTPIQTVAKRELQALHAAIKNDASITSSTAKGSLKEFAAEAMSNKKLQAQLREKKWKLSNAWDGFKSIILRLLGVYKGGKTEPETMLGAAIQSIDALMRPSSERPKAPERSPSQKDIAALHTGSNSMKQFAEQFGDLIKQKDRTPEDAERIGADVLERMELDPQAFVKVPTSAEDVLKQYENYKLVHELSESEPRKLSKEEETLFKKVEEYKRLDAEAKALEDDLKDALPPGKTLARPARKDGSAAPVMRNMSQEEYDNLNEAKKKAKIAHGNLNSLRYETIMSDGKPYDPENPLHYAEATAETFANLKAKEDPTVARREAREIKKQRTHDLRSLVDLLKDNPSYTSVENALVAKAAAKWAVVSDKDGRLKLATIESNNRHNVAVVGHEAADAVIQELRAGKSLKDAFLDGLQKNADKNAKDNSTKNGWQLFKQSHSEQDAVELNKACAGTEWCTGRTVGTARSHIGGGDFYVNYKDGRPEVAVRMNGQDRIGEVRGNTPNQALNKEQQAIAQEFLKNSDFSNAKDYTSEFARKQLAIDIAKGVADMPISDLINSRISVDISFGDNKTASIDDYQINHFLSFRSVDGYGGRPEASEKVKEFFRNKILKAVGKAWDNGYYLGAKFDLYDREPNTITLNGKEYKPRLEDAKAAKHLRLSLHKGENITLPNLEYVDGIDMFGADEGSLSVDLPNLKKINNPITAFGEKPNDSILTIPSNVDVDVRGFGSRDSYITIKGATQITIPYESLRKSVLYLDAPDALYVNDLGVLEAVKKGMADALEVAYTHAVWAKDLGPIHENYDDLVARADREPGDSEEQQKIGKSLEALHNFNTEFAVKLEKDVVKRLDPEQVDIVAHDQKIAEAIAQGAIDSRPSKMNSYFSALSEAIARAFDPQEQITQEGLQKAQALIRDVLEGEHEYIEENVKQDVLKSLEKGKTVIDAPNRIGDIKPPEIANQAPPEPAYARRAKYDEDNPLTRFTKKIIAQEPGFKEMKENLTKNGALMAEMNAVDMRAPVMKAINIGAEAIGKRDIATQVKHFILTADDKVQMSMATLKHGPLQFVKDSKGLIEIQTSNKDSGLDVFKAMSDIPLGNATAKVDMATAYQAAIRAGNKGLKTLDLGALQLSDQELKETLDYVNSNPELKTALEKVRTRYNAYNKGLINFLADSGKITKAKAAELLKDNDYLPFYRVDEDGKAALVFSDDVQINVGDIKHQPYLHALKGGETKILPLDKSMLQNTLLINDAALTNLASRSMAYAFQQIGAQRAPGVKNDMVIHSGQAPAGDNILTFNQQPDPKNPKDEGKRWIRIDTKGTLMEGVPTEMVVKSLEGTALTLPGYLKLAGAASDLLRTGVTRTPLYIAHQLLRDPASSALTGGIESNPFMAILRAGAQFGKAGFSQTKATPEMAELIKRGIIQSNVFKGDSSDLSKFAIQLASGKDMNALQRAVAWADRAAMNADAATRAIIWQDAKKQGLSDVEANIATRESINYQKRGLSASVQHSNRMIPFMGGQIQALNVFAKAARGNMPFNKELDIKKKFYNGALTLSALGLAYGFSLAGNPYYEQASLKDKYGNFFLFLPFVDEPVKIPIPYEVGYFFSLGVAAADAMSSAVEGTDQIKALANIFSGSIPGYSSKGVPQVIKPVLEAVTNTDFNTLQPIESARLKALDPAQRYTTNTTELAKQISKNTGGVVSPIMIEHFVKGYLGQIPLATAAATNSLFDTGERMPIEHASEMPFIGSAFQKKYGGEQANEAYEIAEDAIKAKNTLNNVAREQGREKAKEYLNDNYARIALAPVAEKYKAGMGKLAAEERIIRGRPAPNEVRQAQLDKIEAARQLLASKYLEAFQKVRKNPPQPHR